MSSDHSKPILNSAGQPSVVESRRSEPAEHSVAWKLWLVAKTVQARLRFIIILVAIGGVISYWGTLNSYYEKWTRIKDSDHDHASSEVEYFCPMHPQIVRGEPGQKCPICFMPLSKRNKGQGQAETLPSGTVSRVQLTPYRVVLANVQTSEVKYRPLTKEITTVGFVEFDERKLKRISARISGRSRIDKLFVDVTGQMVQQGDALAVLYSPELVTTMQNLLDAQHNGNRDLERMARDRLKLWGFENEQVDEIVRKREPLTQITIRSPISGHVIRKYQTEGEYVDEGARLYDVADLSSVWIQAQVYEEELAYLKEGLAVKAITPAFPARAPFTGKLAFVHPHLDQNTRTLTVRFDMENPHHELRPGMYATVKIEVPVSHLNLFRQSTADAEREKQLRQGRVLAVPESAVIDTGSRRVVYRESAPGIYDGLEVKLGPRMVGTDEAEYYPVVHGLEAGDRVVSVGSFLIDAETRLNPAAGSIYFGGSASGFKPGSSPVTPARPSMPADQNAVISAAFAKLSPVDRPLAQAQKYCPILPGNQLGSMGTPAKVIIEGKSVFLCCKECKEKAEANAEQTLAKVQELRAKAKAETSNQ